MNWAIIADDLTGAADSAAVFADCGVKTTVWLCEPKEFSDGSCCSVDAHARWRDEKSAARAIGDFVRKLRTADWLMLKIDSTLRGFVGAMVQAAWQSSGRKWALITPAVPKQGRKVVNGRLFVHGQLITEIDLAKEQPAPVTTPSIAQRLVDTGLDKFRLEYLPLETVRQPNRLVQAIEQAATNGVGLICDAEIDKDLVCIVSAAVSAPTQPLFVGASGIAQALAKVTGNSKVGDIRRAGLPPSRISARWKVCSPKTRVRELQLRPSQILVIVGSQQTLAKEQLKFLAAKGVPISEVGGENLPDLSDAEVSAVLLKIALQEHLSPNPQSQVLSPKFRKWLKSNLADALVIVGGLTARAIFEVLGIKRWDLLGSLLPGVPFGVVQLPHKTLLVATKAGGFGTKQTLWRATVELKQIGGKNWLHRKTPAVASEV